MEVLLTLREIEVELTNGRPRNPVLRALFERSRLDASTQAIHASGDSMWLIWSVEGPDADVAALREDLMRPLAAPIEAVDVADGDRGDVTVAVRWARPPAAEGVAIEHLLCDMAAAGNLLRLRVHDGRIEVRAIGHDGEALLRFYQAVRTMLASRYSIRLLRMGEARNPREAARALLRRDEEELLDVALASGYYDEPKRCGVRELGDQLGFSKSVVARKLRTIERRALEQLREPRSAKPT